MSFKVMKKDTRSLKFIRWVVKLFKRKPRLINLNGEELPPAGSILIANHSAASGPMTYRAFLTPPPTMIWGHHAMCGGYRERRRYLVDTFYGQKLGYGKVRAWLSGTLFAIISGWVYRSAGVIPVYSDGRAKQTFQNSVECLKENVSVLIFPENSSEGYKDVHEESFFAGYLTLVKAALRKFGEERPIYCMNYSRKKNCIVIGKPLRIAKLLQSMGKDEVNNFVRTSMNELAGYYA